MRTVALLAFLAVAPLCATDSATLVRENAAIRQLVNERMAPSAWKQTHFIRPDIAVADAAVGSTTRTFVVEKRGGKWVIVAERSAGR
jgi:hypothetical protein